MVLVKPKLDKVDYKFISLKNGIRTLLCSDPDTDKASAAVDVRVGSMLDPDELPGLAHFLEHMLFYASAKYPEEDAYSKYITEHGGHTNAYTSAESTNYHFDVNHDHLEEALDRFAQFFICPMISVDGVEREVNAVDSENGKNLNSDVWKGYQLWKHTSNPDHPFYKFFTGNLQTLLTEPRSKGIDPHERVRQFYEQHYSANLMRVAVYGKEPLEELERMVVERFEQVPNLDKAPVVLPDNVVTEAQQNKLVKWVPEQEGHKIEIQWAVPPCQPVYRAAPCNYLSHLLGHEGEGSVFSLLKSKGWATALYSGESHSSFSTKSFFMCKVHLTDEGHQHVREVLATVFQYLELVKAQGVTREIYEEYRALQEMRFHFRDKLQPYNYATSLARDMQLHEDDDLLLAMYHVPQEFRPDLIRAVLDQLTPQAARIMWSSKAFKDECTESEPWYDTKYSQTSIPSEWLESWSSTAPNESLHLPKPNPFIPSDFTLIQVDSQEDPKVVLQTETVKLWHKCNMKYDTPKGVVVLEFTSPEAYTTPSNAVLSRLFADMVADYLNEVSYDAELAGLAYHISSSIKGFKLTVSGYSHKLLDFTHYLVEQVASFAVREDRFLVVRERLQKDYQNMKYDQPYQRAMYNSSVLLEAKRWHVDQYMAVIDSLTPADLSSFTPRLLKRCSIEGFVTGNIASDKAVEALQRVEQVVKSRSLFPSEVVERRAVKLPDGCSYCYAEPGPNPQNDNSAAVLLYQVGGDDLRLNALGELLVQVAKRDAFHQLRTVEQLGYIVFLTTFSHHGVRSVVLILQSTAFTAEHLDGRVEAFLGQFTEKLEAMEQEEFDGHVTELAKAKLERPKTLSQEATRDWREIDTGSFVFDRPQREVDALKALSRAELLEFYNELMHQPLSRRKLAVHVKGCNEHSKKGAANGDAETSDSGAVGNGEQQTDATTEDGALHGTEGGRAVVIDDLWQWKRQLDLYPDQSGGLKKVAEQ